MQSTDRWPVDPADPDRWKSEYNTPWDRQFLALENGYLLDWDPADGSHRVWRFVPGDKFQLTSPTALKGGPREELRRGHRLIHLGPGRLLEWAPCPPPPRGQPAACTGATYHLLKYSLDADTTTRDPIEPPVASGVWPEITAHHQIVMADPGHLVVWSPAEGKLRSYALPPADAAAADPLAGPWMELIDPRLRALPWDPPTAAPAIKKLVVILQDGRSFDAYFGRYCRGAPGVTCAEGPDCCEDMTKIPGAPACQVPDPDHKPNSSPTCMRAKMNDGRMDSFASAPDGVVLGGSACGDPRDIACAGTGDEAGAVGAYHRLAAQGALADHFFQTYAFTEDPRIAPNPFDQNVLYLTTTCFAPSNLTKLSNKPFLTKEMVRNNVTWATYSGNEQNAQFERLNIPIFYDPAFAPFRTLERQDPDKLVASEWEYDLNSGQLPAVSILVPDRDDPERSEAPGMPFDKGIDFVDKVVKAIADSPDWDKTLVLVTYLTAGGFHDHVPPPKPPSLDVDGTVAGDGSGEPRAVHYGPRVPLLALGPFARPNHIAHGQLELSSIARFVEWNWLYGRTVKGMRSPEDPRSFRDAAVANLGELLNPMLGVP